MLLNRATQGQYAPGSTFKLVTTLEFMRENADFDSYSYNCTGSIESGDVTIHCYGGHVHGQVTLRDSLCLLYTSRIRLLWKLTAIRTASMMR